MDDKKLRIIVPILVLVLISLVGVSYGINSNGKWLSFLSPKSQAPAVTKSSPTSIKISPLFDSQTASITGEIDKVDGSKITVKKKSLVETFTVSPKAVIYKYRPNTPATPSSGLKTIETGKSALILLEAINGEYQVVSISYLASPPPATPSPSPKAKSAGR